MSTINLARLGRTVGFTLGAAAGIAGAGALAALRRPLPRLAGKLALDGLAARAQVLRDRWGVPHIYAASSSDLFMAQGFVHAQDRLWQMELNRRTGHGQLAELFGPVALSSDRFMRVLGFSRLARAEVELLDEQTREVVEAYVRGVNAFLAHAGGRLPIEFTLLRHRPQPWQVSDVLVWNKVMALNLSENWTVEVLRARLVAAVGAERADQLEPRYRADQPLAVPAGATYTVATGDDALKLASEASRFTGGTGFGQGSNAWVVGGQRSTSGLPLLANDPHLGLALPAIWYANHLEGGDYNVAGVSFPGAPGVVLGHNARIAWGVTNAMTDVQDLYIERFDPADPLRYAWRDGWEAATLVHEEIIVKGQPAPVVEQVRITRHGPVVSPLIPADSAEPQVLSTESQALSTQHSALSTQHSALSTQHSALSTQHPAPSTQHSALSTQHSALSTQHSEALALRWTALDPARILRSVLRINRARNWDEFRAALSDWNVPAQNFVYADVDGHFGYALGGDLPLRARGDGRLPVPGWDGAHEWIGYIPAAELPAALDPAEGFAVTANNQIVDTSYPHAIEAEWLNGYRAARIRQLLEETAQHDASSFARIHRDVRSLPGLEFAALAERLPADTPLRAAARDALAGWDGELNAESTAGAIYAALRHHLLRRAYHELGDLTRAAVGLGAFASLPASMYLERALPELLRRVAARDDAWLGNGRSFDGVLAEAWDLALAELRTQLGDNVSTWRYGRLHQLMLRHPLGAQPALTRLLNRGPWPAGGDEDTVCKVYLPRDSATGPVCVAPSMRQILDPSNWDNSRSSYPGGQSGHPGSRNYGNLIGPWLAGQYHPMPWSRASVEQASVATLTLEPA